MIFLDIIRNIYFFTEFILTLCRDRKIDSDRFAYKQLMFMSSFYIFYWYAGALQQHFAILLIGGALLQLIEAFARKNPLRKVVEESFIETPELTNLLKTFYTKQSMKDEIIIDFENQLPGTQDLYDRRHVPLFPDTHTFRIAFPQTQNDRRYNQPARVKFLGIFVSPV